MQRSNHSKNCGRWQSLQSKVAHLPHHKLLSYRIWVLFDAEEMHLSKPHANLFSRWLETLPHWRQFRTPSRNKVKARPQLWCIGCTNAYILSKDAWTWTVQLPQTTSISFMFSIIDLQLTSKTEGCRNQLTNSVRAETENPTKNQVWASSVPACLKYIPQCLRHMHLITHESRGSDRADHSRSYNPSYPGVDT